MKNEGNNINAIFDTKKIEEALEILTPRELQVLGLRFGILNIDSITSEKNKEIK